MSLERCLTLHLGMIRQGLGLDIWREHINSTGLIEGAADTKISETTMHYIGACRENINNIGSTDHGDLAARTTEV